MSEELHDAAVRNNASWCSVVCAGHGSAGEWGTLAWTHATLTPRYYPNAVTLTAERDQTEALVDGLRRARPLGDWSVKDSYAALALETRGWSVLFTAEWLFHSARGADRARGSRVRDAASLVAWERAWLDAAGEQSRVRTFTASLLRDERVAVLSLSEAASDIDAGVVAFRADGVVGLTNLFVANGELASGYSRAVAAAAHHFPEMPIVTYARGTRREAAGYAGFQQLGPLRVWTHPAVH